MPYTDLPATTTGRFFIIVEGTDPRRQGRLRRPAPIEVVHGLNREVEDCYAELLETAERLEKAGREWDGKTGEGPTGSDRG